MSITAGIGDIIEVSPLFDQSGLTLPIDVKVRYSFNNITYFDGFGGNTSGFTFEVSSGTPVYAKYTYNDNSSVIDDTGNAISNVLETIFIDSSTFANTVTLTKTEAVYDFDGPQGNGLPTSTVDKTVSWTLGSNSEIVSGTFLDGSPWVVDNGNLYLISTTPEQTAVTFGAVTDNGDGTYDFDYTNQYTKLYDIHNTVINPDFGTRRRMNASKQSSTFSSTESEHYEPNIFISSDKPFDGRAGLNYVNNYVTDPADVGNTYYDQKWTTLARKLETGDNVFVQRSMYLPMKPINSSGEFDSVEQYEDGALYYWGVPLLQNTFEDCPQVEQICILNVLDSVPPTNAYRPPANWDIADKANRPIFTEQDDLSGSSFDYPNYTYFSDETPDWVGDSSRNTESYYTGPTDSAVFVTMANTANDMRQYFPASQTDRGYGGYESNAIERMIVQAYDSNNSESVRNAARRRVTQQGIDAYGMWKSTGKWDQHTGYHGGHYTPSMIMAWLVCGQPEEMYGILNGDYVGSTGSNNYVLSSDWKGFTGFYPALYYHEGNQRYKIKPDYVASNIDYIYESCDVIEQTAGETAGYVLYSTTESFTITYDQIIDIERIPSIREGSDFDKLTIIKNLHNILGYNNQYPGWGVHNNTYFLTPERLVGLIIKGSNGYGRVIWSAAEDPDNGEFYSRRYDPEFKIVNKIRLFIKGFPATGPTDSISCFRSSITEAEQERAFVTITTGGISCTSAIASTRDYHYSTQAYQHAAALWANTAGGESNLPLIAKRMYEHSKLHVTDPYYRNSRIENDGYNLGTVIPNNGYYDDPANVSPRILNQDGSDNLASALFRQFYFDDPSQPADNPIVVGRKETWPDEDLSEYVYPDRTFLTSVDDFYCSFSVNFNANNGTNYYDIDGNIIYPNTDGSRRNWTQIKDWFPNFGQTELGQDTNYAPTVPQYVVDGVTLDSIIEIKIFDDGIEWQNFLKDKTIYAWRIGGNQPLKFKAINEPSPTAVNYTVVYARVDENDNFLPDVWDYDKEYVKGERILNFFATSREI
jgi:hypothetical protein